MRIALAYFENFTEVAGGLQRAVCRLAGALTARGHEVAIVVYDRRDGRPYYELDPAVALINLRKPGPERLALWYKGVRETRRLFGGKQAVRQWSLAYRTRRGMGSFAAAVGPVDVAAAFTAGTCAMLRRQGVEVPLVASLRNDPAVLWRDFLPEEREALRRCAAIHVLLPAFADLVRSYTGNETVVAIPNAIAPMPPVDRREKAGPRRIINVARLKKSQKRQDLLVRAFARLSERHPGWIVECWGSGDSSGAVKDGVDSGYLGEMKAFLRARHLEDRVLFRGTTRDIAGVLGAADIFAFPSAYEGFPNAMGEPWRRGSLWWPAGTAPPRGPSSPTA